MKKLLAAFALLLLCTTTAAAVTIQNETDPGDVQAQAGMLKALGLFRGTEQGFELERAMRRDEAAAMLVRFLGAEDTALAGGWKHPFTDVPAWADPYVGWLYASGLTKGVSKTRYGAAEAVTCDQYCVFLNRASMGDDNYAYHIAQPDEVASCDRAGFTRGDAVVLSARTLSALYAKNGNSMSMAQFLIEKGVFTAEQLKQAAWDVLARDYTVAEDPSDPYGDLHPACRIAGVVVARNAGLPPLSIVYDEGNACSQVYAVEQPDGGAATLYALDPQTLAATEIYTIVPLEDRYAYVYPVGAAGGKDYLLTGDGKLLEISGQTVLRALDARQGGYYPQKDQNYFRGADGLLVWIDGGLLVIDDTGVRTLETSADERIFAIFGDRAVTQAASAGETVICNRSLADGAALDVYTVPNDDLLKDGQDETMREYFTPRLFAHNSVYLWGDAGLYRMEDGRLRRITARAAIDYGYDASDGSHVILSHEPGKRVEYTAKTGGYNPAGDEIYRIHADGTEELLLSDTPAHGAAFYKLARASGGEVRALNWNWVLEYAVEGGKLRVLPPSDTWDPAQYRDSIASEQKRLDALGAGVGG